MSKTESTHLRIPEKTHIQLLYLSKITGLSMTEIVRSIMENVTPISVMYQKGCSFSVEHRITESSVTIVLHGVSNSFVCGHSPTDAKMKEDVKTAFEMAEKENKEDFGEIF